MLTISRFLVIMCCTLVCNAVMAGESVVAQSPYKTWQHHGAMIMNTTATGAAMPATAACEKFPLLVRLHKDWFDFSQAKTNGDDIRFVSESGEALPYFIESWDSAAGSAAIWVRIPKITGDTRQALHICWGKSDAASESKNQAVFNLDNGYVGVWHLHGDVNDSVGSLQCIDNGTTDTVGLIGKARHFAGEQGIFCGDKITTFPSGSESHTTEVWIRPAASNGVPVAWGLSKKQGKIVVQVAAPPTIHIDAWFSTCSAKGKIPVTMGNWSYVVNTYTKDSAHLFVNGQLDVETKKGTAMDIGNPARMWIGGWYNKYSFTGDIDEVRISNVKRTAEWVQLQYENQKVPQTLVGHLIQPGKEFSVSESQVTVAEGKSATISVKAGGAEKIMWLAKIDDQELVIASDLLNYKFEAERVSADQQLTLICKAIYPDKVESKNIAITIKNTIPDPEFTLEAPRTWDGRSPITVTPKYSNASALQATGADQKHVEWFVDNVAVIKETSAEKLLLFRSQNSGNMVVRAEINNGGQTISQSVTIVVKEPARDPWVGRQPAADEKPQDGQFYAQNDKNIGTLYYNGSLTEQPELQQAESLFLKIYADDKLIDSIQTEPKGDKFYSLTAQLKPGLIIYKVEFGVRKAGQETILRTVDDIVCGDAYIIDGQSNALATDTREESPPETHQWIRSYGIVKSKDMPTTENLWCRPVWKARKGEKAELGWWGMELAKRLVESQKIPICIINGAVGGTRVDQHQRNEQNPTDLESIYGRMLWRVQQARLTHGIRGILWHQGENNQGAASPTGDYDWKSYERYFVEMSSGWKRDFPNVQHYYIFQIWPNACGMGGNSGCGDMIREIQRSLPRLYANMSVMSTLGISPPGGCHYPLVGWAEFARLMQPLIERDNYGLKPKEIITPANVQNIYVPSANKDTIVLEFDQPIIWEDTLISQFYLDGQPDLVASGKGQGSTITLTLKSPTTAKSITYLKESNWSQKELLFGANGIAALTFCNVGIQYK